MFVSYLDFIFTHFTYFTFEIGILVFLCVVHSHGLRPCRSGKPRQGIIPCTLSASPADGRKGRESPAFLSASILPCHSVKCCPTATRSAYCHLTSFPLHSRTHSTASLHLPDSINQVFFQHFFLFFESFQCR